jgi:hypothetical protein
MIWLDSIEQDKNPGDQGQEDKSARYIPIEEHSWGSRSLNRATEPDLGDYILSTLIG